MAKKRDLIDIKEVVKKFGNLIRNKGYADARMILFGSWAKGKETEWSDIDICVISKKLGKNMFDEKMKLTKIAMNVDGLIEPIPMSPDEYNDKYNTLAMEVRKYGKVIV